MLISTQIDVILAAMAGVTVTADSRIENCVGPEAAWHSVVVGTAVGRNEGLSRVADLVPGLKLAHAEGKARESGRALSISMMPCAG
jgi:hypothetical protein